MKKQSSFVIIFLFVAGNIFADIKLPGVFQDNMVLQRGTEISLWGWADPGEKISASLEGNYSEKVAGADGKWEMVLGPMDAGGPYELVLKGNNKITLKNILLGEVWVCSGQSNMEMPVGNVANWYSGVLNYEEEIAAADFPQIRLFRVNRTVADKPRDSCKGTWEQCTSTTIFDFSAVAYFFGRELYRNLDVPIGLIDASHGGTDISAWIKKEILESDPQFVSILDEFHQKLAKYPQALIEYEQKLAEVHKAIEEAKATGKPVPWRRPMPPVGPGHYNTPSGLYNGMIAPLTHYRIAGVIWYQGENDTHRASLYQKLFPALIENWRKDWGQGDFGFYYVQLAGFDTEVPWWRGSGLNWVLLREAQLTALSVPNTGMAVAIDIGDAEDTHAKNKQAVGKRLALWALAKTYGKNIVYSGPVYKSMEIDDNLIKLHFDHIGSGLISKKGEKLKGFMISGEDGGFIEADAVIKNNIVIVSSEKIKKPVAARYGWDDFSDCNLYNIENLPAPPFRTDNWIK